MGEAAGLEQCSPPQTLEMINEQKAGAGLGGRGSGKNVILVTRPALKMEQSIMKYNTVKRNRSSFADCQQRGGTPLENI